MTALEIRLIAYAIAAIVLLGGSGFVGYRITANHYEALIARDRASQDKALQDAQQKVISAQQAQQAATQASEQKYVDLKNQFDALVSFAYNAGTGAFAQSTLLKLLNARQISQAADEFLKWDNVAGKPNGGLLRRRRLERALFLDGVQ